MVKIKHEIASINQNKQMSIFSIIVLISISFVFLMSAISFTVDGQNVLAQNSVNVFSSSGNNGGAHNTASVNINSATTPSLATTTTAAATKNNLLSDAQSVYNTGKMVLPSSVSGYIISLPDETHHPDTDGLQISPQNGHYLPENLVIPSGTAIAFAHGDPNHVHSEILTDSSGNQVWTTNTISHPGATDSKVFPPGTYTITDAKYPPMKGIVTVDQNVKSTGANLVAGAIFAPTSSLDKIRSEFQSAGFQITSTFDFTSAVTKQPDISGPTTLIVYSTSQPLDDAKTNLLPILKSLPYK